VAKGRNEHQGIYTSWSECASWVPGVPGNIHQKFGTYREAHEFIEHYNQGKALQTHQGKLSRPGSGGSEKPIGPKAEQTLGAEAFEKHMTTAGNLQSRPDLKYLGPNPSVKTEDMFYGCDVMAELDLVEELLPKDIEPSLKKGVCQALADVVALPGGYQSNLSGKEDGLALFTQSMAEMAHGGKTDSEIFGRPDFNWRGAGRTGLKAVVGPNKLQSRIKLLVKFGQKIRRQTVKLVVNALKRAGWRNENTITAWAQGGPIYRLISDTLDYNLSLYQHFMGLSASAIHWSYVQKEINYHVEEMTLIRSSADSRVQVLVQLYCYLRDGNAANWQSSSLKAIRNVEMFAKGPQPALADGTSPGNIVHCSKCGTINLHTGGPRNFPWRNLSQKKAKQTANKFIQSPCASRLTRMRRTKNKVVPS
jgi:hypothetical protein